jgi:fucose permease
MLPLLLARWSMTDAQAGWLLFLFFVGTASGALLSRGLLSRSIVRGCAATALGGLLLAVASRPVAFAAITIYGVGLGITMTSITLLQSRRYPADRIAQMARLNLAWSIGACLGPSIALRGGAALSPPAMLCALSAFFVLAAVLVLRSVPQGDADVAFSSPVRPPVHVAGIPLVLMLLVPLATGIESAAGGWLATYSKRSAGSLGVAVGAATFFWAGMLLSRLLQSYRRTSLPHGWMLLLGPCLMFAALVLVLNATDGPAMLGGALLLGLGVGPMYPLLLALALRHGEGRNLIFVIAGAGASLLPLITGLVSGWAGSLRAGLGVPLIGALTMACLGLVQYSSERREA